MAAITRVLADGLDVRTEQRVHSIQRQGPGWNAVLDTGEALEAEAIILTPPLPQSLVLLEAGGVNLPATLRGSLESINYEVCLTLLAVLQSLANLPGPGAAQFTREPLAWIADNSKKGLSPEVPTVTIHAGREFSQLYWDANGQTIAALMLEAAWPWIETPPLEWEVQRWRYSRPAWQYRGPALRVADEPPLILAGDAFAGPRVESAALSGLAAAELLKSGK
jgi:predicted NAD/FAD-dependent oxidoreductase